MAVKSLRANGTIRVARFVKQDTGDNNSVLEADANEQVIGVSQMGGRDAPIPTLTTDPVEAAQAGDDLKFHSIGDNCLIEAGGTITAGAFLKSDADGKAVVIATTGTTLQRYGGYSEEAAADGELFKMVVLPGSERPALS